MTTNEIRTKFLNFFKSKGHSIIVSDSLVPKDDPTVLFTTAGMQQFKPQFLGHLDGFSRAATCQKCLRTDDLDVVGKTDFHHTFFEMLGNFSFGDYFKKEAIHWAWEFLTREMKLPQEKLWVSVYQDDAEAYAVWANEIKIPKDRIVKLGDKSNFWPSNARLNGPNGPCGPCSEIFYDYGVNPNCKSDKCDPDCSCGRFCEVWNLVFTQFNRKDGGTLEPLPAKNIDTGMGLERLVAVVQGVKSNYETDLFQPIIMAIREEIKMDDFKLNDSQIFIIADHMRAVIVAISDGVNPSNKGRGFVVKRLITDCTDLILNCCREPFLNKLVPIIIDVMSQPYPELGKNVDEISTQILRVQQDHWEIHKFQVPELKRKIEEIRTKAIREDINNAERNKLLGDLAFHFRDTHGLTLTTIQHVFEQTGYFVGGGKWLEEILAQYNIRMEEQRDRSRAGSKMTGDVYANQDFALNLPKTEFLGYTETKSDVQVLKILNDQGEMLLAHQGQTVKVILNRTPFYAEAGGQIGDTGYLMAVGVKVRVTDTCKANDIYIHSGIIEQGNIKAGDKVQAVVDEPRRRAIMRNHTATHLLQAALREVLGAHVKQQGSLVEENRFRFDFTHPKGLKPQEVQKIEDKVNEFIRSSDSVVTEVLSLEEAKKKGALAFFAEKYGQTVRVLSIGGYSREFCGGTHVSSTNQIEAMKIVSEGSIAQGIRRIEGLTGKASVEDFLKRQAQESAAIEEAQRIKRLEKEKQNVYFDQVKSSVDEMIAGGEKIKGSTLIVRSLQEIDITLLRKLSDLLKQKVKSGIFILGSKGVQDASVLLCVTDDLVARGIKANELMGQIALLMDGSGGGKPQLAQAGSKQPQKLDGALVSAQEIVKAKL